MERLNKQQRPDQLNGRRALF